MKKENRILKTKCKVKLSENLNRQLEHACKILDVTKKNLTLFLLLNKYDSLYKDIKKGKFENVKRELDVNYESCIGTKKDLPSLQFEMNDFVNSKLTDLADKLGYTKEKLITLMLYKNQELLDTIVTYYENRFDKLYVLSDNAKKTNKNQALDCCLNTLFNEFGISKSCYAKISMAYVCYNMFFNMQEELWSEVYYSWESFNS